MPILHQPAPSDTARQPDGDLPALPHHTLERLHAEGIRSLGDWRELGPRRRRAIFGITRKTADLLDAAAHETSA